VIEAQGRYLGDPEQGACEQTTVTRNYIALAVKQDRDIKSKSFDAFGDLPDLLLTVMPRITGVRFKIVD
jgi:hypothetical protein